MTVVRIEDYGEGIQAIVFDRPGSPHNFMDMEVVVELHEVIRSLAADEKVRGITSTVSQKDDSIIESAMESKSISVSDVRFPIFGSDLQMEITGGMVQRIASVVAAGNPGFVPIIRIDDSGVVSIQWESTGGSTQSE